MKIKIAYSAGEVDKAVKLARACLAFFPKDTKAHYSDRHKPFLHVYIADRSKGREKQRFCQEKTGGNDNV